MGNIHLPKDTNQSLLLKVVWMHFLYNHSLRGMTTINVKTLQMGNLSNIFKNYKYEKLNNL